MRHFDKPCAIEEGIVRCVRAAMNAQKETRRQINLGR